MDCLSLCCGKPAQCSRVCRNKPDMFVTQLREVCGFNLSSVSRAPAQWSNLGSDIVPLIYHGSRRREQLRCPTIALRLADLIDFRRRRIRFSNRVEMCAAFRIDPSCKIILTGVDHDARIEPWWGLGEARNTIISSLGRLGIALVTTPNFSLLVDNPRTDDLHAMSRIAIIFAETQNGGLACALHPNSRTTRDFERWAAFVKMRPEVSTLAYEFITGSGCLTRSQFHVDGLIRIAKSADRPMDLVLRGDPKVIPLLQPHYREILYIDTTAFIKAQKRRVAEQGLNDGLRWRYTPTAPDEGIDSLVQENVERHTAFLRAKYLNRTSHHVREA